MSQDYKISGIVKPGFQEWSNEYGSFRTYSVQVEGNGEPISINRKADSPAPVVGDEIYGDLTDSKYGQKFKSVKKPFIPGASPKAGNGWESPERQDSINRAVALNNSVNLYAGTKTLPETVLLTADTFLEWLKPTEPEKEEKPVDKPEKGSQYSEEMQMHIDDMRDDNLIDDENEGRH